MSRTINVTTADELLDALLAAKGGEKILLAAGNYGDLNVFDKLGFNGAFASNVTIASKDAANPATFTGMNLIGTGNITIEDVVFDYTRDAADWANTLAFQLKYVDNITIKNSVFDGDTKPYNDEPDAEDYGWGYGLSVRSASNVVLEGNEFKDWTRALIVDTAENVVVRDNDVHDIRTDGMNFIRVTDVLVEDNHIHDFKAAYQAGDHRDMIQFWTSGSKTPSTDIVIRNNTLDIGEGSYTQSIFMRNEAVDSQGGGDAMYYQNVLIENNTIYNGHLHGITVGETDGLTIKGNSLVAIVDDDNPDQTGSALWVPVINVKAASENVTITNNAVAKINGDEGQADWSVKNNAFIQNSNPFGPGYYDDVFVSSSRDVGENGHAFVATPGEMLAVLQAGTKEILKLSLTGTEALFQIEEGDQNTRTFDASLTEDLLAGQGISGAEYTWHFGDGQTAKGLSVAHNFTHAGEHDITLVVTTPSQTFVADSSLSIMGGDVISFDGSEPAFTAHAYGEETTLSALDNVSNNAIQLGASGTSASVTQTALKGLRGTDTLDIDFTIAGEGVGEVFRLHGSFIATVTSKGEVVVQLYDSTGAITAVRSIDVSVTDGKPHDVSLHLADGTLELSVDDVVVHSKSFDGTLPTSGSWGLAFGNPWGKANFEGEISEFSIRAGEALAPLPDNIEDIVVSTGTPTPVEAPAETVVTTEVEETVEIPETVEIVELIGDEATVETGEEATPVVLPDSFSESGWAMNEDAPLVLDGDYKSFGRLKEYEDSQTLGISVDFTTDSENGSESRLVWNHMKLGLTVLDDEIMIQAATKDAGFRAFKTEGLGLTKSELHNATVMLDSENDRLQVLVDDEVVIDVDDVDFDHVGAGGREWGWSLGNPWGRAYKGEVSEFEVTDQFDFSEDQFLHIQDDFGV